MSSLCAASLSSSVLLELLLPLCQGVPGHLPGIKSQAVGTAGPCWGWPWMPSTRLSLCSLSPTDHIPACQAVLSPPELPSCSPAANISPPTHTAGLELGISGEKPDSS